MKRFHTTLYPVFMMLAGCAGLPPMPGIAPHQPTAEVQLSPNMGGAISVFYDGKGYALSTGDDGIALIPAGLRVSFYRYVGYSENMGAVTEMYHCYPGASFYPMAGLKYYVDFELRKDRCALFIFRENGSRIGIGFEPSYLPAG